MFRLLKSVIIRHNRKCVNEVLAIDHRPLDVSHLVSLAMHTNPSSGFPISESDF